MQTSSGVWVVNGLPRHGESTRPASDQFPKDPRTDVRAHDEVSSTEELYKSRRTLYGLLGRNLCRLKPQRRLIPIRVPSTHHSRTKLRAQNEENSPHRLSRCERVFRAPLGCQRSAPQIRALSGPRARQQPTPWWEGPWQKGQLVTIV